ncbi:uncharacterized protein V1518DRAFT_6091 [Limtongia smithiae]|uniref:uncharacterized protein n=1 Tax=Limtongia smithiae TaxID=1125753 RepID=UPI0034CFB57E
MVHHYATFAPLISASLLTSSSCLSQAAPSRSSSPKVGQSSLIAMLWSVVHVRSCASLILRSCSSAAARSNWAGQESNTELEMVIAGKPVQPALKNTRQDTRCRVLLRAESVIWVFQDRQRGIIRAMLSL